MKFALTLSVMFLAFASIAQNKAATTTYEELSQTTTVEIDINADAATVWKLLTTAEDYPNWNSTVIEIKGTIALDEKIKLKSTLAPKKKFKLTVKTFEANKKLVWGDKKGTRTFTITDIDGGVHVVMTETIGSKSYPMWKKYLPKFEENFDQFVADLKKAAEGK